MKVLSQFSSRQRQSKTSEDKIKKEEKINESEKCDYFNRGYCKWQNDCEKKHNDKVCNNIDCDEDKCEVNLKKHECMTRLQELKNF